MSRDFAFSHVLLCKIFNVHCGSTSEIFSVARKERKQVSTCGHKFSMFEKLLSTQSSLLGQALVGAKPLHLLSQTALPLESPTGAFIAAQPRPCWGVPSPNPAPASHRWCENAACLFYIAPSIRDEGIFYFHRRSNIPVCPFWTRRADPSCGIRTCSTPLSAANLRSLWPA